MSRDHDLADVLGVLESAYPLAWAEAWDRAGLVVGDRSAPVHRIHLAVDPTIHVIDEAAAAGADLLVTHHPLLLRGASFLPTDTGKGAAVTTLIRSGVALWCGHTNVDRSTRGTVGAWVDALGLADVEPLAASPGAGDEAGHGSRLLGLGAVGSIPTPTTVRELATLVARTLPATAQGIRYTGDAHRPVRRVAVTPGAGDSFLAEATASGADVYITSDLRHHPALEHVESAADAGAVPALIDVAHSASEALWLPLAARLLADALPDVEIQVSELSTDPFSGHIDQ